MDKPKDYRITGYGDMIADRPRMRAYAQALEQAVFPGCSVLDIGAGTGIFSLLACRFGARRVDAVIYGQAFFPLPPP
jgi:type I protein arginine methyltransferase